MMQAHRTMLALLKACLACAIALASTRALAEECLPADPIKFLEQQRSESPVALTGGDARAFAAQAREAGVPMTENPDYVFLRASGGRMEADWLEDAGQRIATACSWSGRPNARFGKLVADWLRRSAD